MALTTRHGWVEVGVPVDDRGHVLEFRYAPGNAKPTVLFVAGWGLAASSYTDCLVQMSEWSAPIGVSLPGFGGSTPLSKGVRPGLDGYADALVAAWDATGLGEPLPLVAHSMGSGVVVHLAMTRPELVSSLTLVCPIGGTDGSLANWWKLGKSLAAEAHVQFVPRLRSSAGAILKHPAAAAKSAIVARHTRLVSDLREVVDAGIEVTLVFAEDDGVVPPGDLPMVLGASQIVVPGAHGWLIREPELFADTIRDTVRLTR